MKTTGRNGFTLLEIMIVVTIIGFLAGLGIPAFMKTRATAQKARCIDNLRQISGFKDTWAVENFANTGDPVTDADVTPFFKRGFPVCPGGGIYNVDVVGTPPSCSLATMGHVVQ